MPDIPGIVNTMISPYNGTQLDLIEGEFYDLIRSSLGNYETQKYDYL